MAFSFDDLQLTFRSLSLSRNISLSTSLVSAALTVCMVAVEQRLCGREKRREGEASDTENHTGGVMGKSC